MSDDRPSGRCLAILRIIYALQIEGRPQLIDAYLLEAQRGQLGWPQVQHSRRRLRYKRVPEIIIKAEAMAAGMMEDGTAGADAFSRSLNELEALELVVAEPEFMPERRLMHFCPSGHVVTFCTWRGKSGPRRWGVSIFWRGEGRRLATGHWNHDEVFTCYRLTRGGLLTARTLEHGATDRQSDPPVALPQITLKTFSERVGCDKSTVAKQLKTERSGPYADKLKPMFKGKSGQTHRYDWEAMRELGIRKWKKDIGPSSAP